MRYELGPTFRKEIAPSAEPSPNGKLDPKVEHLRDDGSVATFAVETYSFDTHNKLCEVRLYFVPEGSELPVDANDYVASGLPFGHADTSGLQSGGEVPIQIPSLDPSVYHAQYVLGFCDQ